MEKEIFAQGLCFYKLFCVFVTGAFLGDVVETLFCRMKSGEWMSRSSFVYGQFSVVWGFAFVIATLLFYNLSDFPVIVLYTAGVVVGGIYEYVCGLLAEKLLGTTFWDYRSMRWNIKGRVNLLYCQFWGLATVIWVKDIFPFLEGLIEKIPVRAGETISNVLLILFVLDGLISAAAIRRYVERKKGKGRDTRVWKWIDDAYPDHRMEKIYPVMKVC